MKGKYDEIPAILPSEEHLPWHVKELLKLEYRGGPTTNPPRKPLARRTGSPPDLNDARRSLKNLELVVTSVDFAASLALAQAGSVNFGSETCRPVSLEAVAELVQGWANVKFGGLNCEEVSSGVSRFAARELNVGNKFRAWSATLAKQDEGDPSIDWVVSIRVLERVQAAQPTAVVVRLGRSSSFAAIKPFTTPAAPPRVIRDLLSDPRFVALDGNLEVSARPRELATDKAELRRFAQRELFSPSRRLPIVGLTSTLRKDLETPDPQKVAKALAGIAHVVVIPLSGTWTLQELIGDDLKVFGGASRIWWPGATRRSGRFEHPLLLARPLPRLARGRRLSIEHSVVEPVVDAARDRVGELRLIDYLASRVTLRTHRDALKRMQGAAATLAGQAPSKESDEVVAKLRDDVELAIEEMAAQELTINTLSADVAEREQRLQWQEHEIRRLNAQLEELRADVSAPSTEVSVPEAAFLSEVRSRYKRAFSSADRRSYPLVELRVGHQFLASLDAFSNLYDKVVRVCAEVGCRRASRINGREVHRLRRGSGGGDPQRMRASDGAGAFRCAVQRGTPQAARLHWWERGDTIEFACVVKHDDMSIPE